MANLIVSLDDAPCELQCAIREFWPPEEQDNAANVAFLESGWNAFALADTRDSSHPCGSLIRTVDGVAIAAEFSIGYFQIDACNFPDWPSERFYNARHNAGTAHLLWSQRGWEPWYFSAKALGLLPAT
jgi:hypothetical protein